MNHHTAAMRHDPHYKRTRDWPRANHAFYALFREWLHATGCGPTMIPRYTAAARWVFCLLDQPYWQIDPDADLATVQAYLDTHFDSAETRHVFQHGLAKFAIFLRLKCHRPAPQPMLHWDYYLAALPPALGQDIRDFLAVCQARWPADKRYERSRDLVGPLTRVLRALALARADADMAAPGPGQAQGQGLSTWADLTPQQWWAYTEARLSAGIAPRTLNIELHQLQAFLHYLSDQGQAVCARMFRVEPFPPTPRLPRDVPPESLRRLLGAVQAQVQRRPINQGRMGVLDRAWVLLMLHGGLRSGEVRRLRLSDLDWARGVVRIEQSKGLKDRLVPLSEAVQAALRAWLAVRGPAETLPAQLFVFNHQPLSQHYCRRRLDFYGAKIGVHLTPHQLRHSCATLLLNAGMPLVTVKTILGHQHLDTTLLYARLYDGTLAADYHRAMRSVEQSLAVAAGAVPALTLTPGELVALADSLRAVGPLSAAQLDTLATLRAGLVRLAAGTCAQQEAGTQT